MIWTLPFRPSTLCQRSSEAHRSTRTTLRPSTLLQTRHGEAQTNEPKHQITHAYLTMSVLSDLKSSFVHRPAIVVLLMSMVNERQPFVLRCAVLYCFQCFLYKNQKGQGEIVATLLPSTIDGQSSREPISVISCAVVWIVSWEGIIGFSYTSAFPGS